MPKQVIILLAEGFEEVEAITPIDYLRRADIQVVVAAIGASKTVKSSHGLLIVADASLAELGAQGKLNAIAWDGILVPGGGQGATNIASSMTAGTLLKDMAGSGRLVAAICASPVVVLAPLGILSGKRFTCFPGMEKNVRGAHWVPDRVVVDGNLVTSRAAGTAGEWAYQLIDILSGSETAKKVADAILLQNFKA